MGFDATETNLEPGEYGEYARLLRKVLDVGEYYPPLTSADSERLRTLARAGMIHWCPYPEEFYIITPVGKRFVESEA